MLIFIRRGFPTRDVTTIGWIRFGGTSNGWDGLGPHYDAQSNVTMAHQLGGKLLLMVGELDKNVDPSSTFQVVNVLDKGIRILNGWLSGRWAWNSRTT